LLYRQNSGHVGAGRNQHLIARAQPAERKVGLKNQVQRIEAIAHTNRERCAYVVRVLSLKRLYFRSTNELIASSNLG